MIGPERHCETCGCRCHCYAQECPTCPNDVCVECKCEREDDPEIN